MSQDDFQFEPVPGLPSHLPEGEEILWQGRPSIWGFARDVLKLRWVAGYFLFLMVWRGIANSDQGLAAVLQNTLPLIGFASAAALVLLGLAAIMSVTTIYTITSRRVVIRKGAALSFALNLPFSKMLSADMSKQSDGTGTIAFAMSEEVGLGYMMLWPHVRPWHAKTVLPSLRSIKDAARVSDILAEAAVTSMRDAPDVRPQPEAVPNGPILAAE